MKYAGIFLALLICLSGCAAAPAETTAPTEAPTTIPTAAATEPPTTVPPDPVEELLSAMTMEEKVGQLFLARCPDGNAIEDIAAYHLGGYILFDRDVRGETRESFTEKVAGYQAVSKIPMLIAVDEEGGTVCRLSSYTAFRYAPFPSPRSLYESRGLEVALSVELEKAYFLHELGVNVNMAPVCDVTTQRGAFMYSRSLGQSPEITGEFVAGAVTRMAKFQVGSVLKHFPGYGNNTDTHTGIATDWRSLEELESVDLVPFAAGIEAGCGAVMVSHTIVTAFDSELPATLSPAVHSYLREEMGFEGVIVTDDLVMGAITETYGADEAAVLAVLAGNDLLCSTEYQVQYQAVLEAVQDGRISMELLDEAVLRILNWKMELGLI
ncbi:MAG: beta-hexosaminidase [Oscillospiraceae bacterium]|nr:beta-hexosaminidase [Oscillospiraceae bacterium]